MTRVLGQQERVRKKQRQQEKLVLPRREEGWAPEEGAQHVLQGLQRGDSRYWRGQSAAGGELVGRAMSVDTGGGCAGEAQVHGCAQCSKWTVTLMRECLSAR